MGARRNELIRRASYRALFYSASYVLVAVISGIVLFDRARTTSFDGDESGWILSGYHYGSLLLNHDFDHEKWECPECLSFGHLTTHVGQFLIGIPLILYTNGSGPRFSDYYDWSRSYEQNAAEHRVPPNDVLMPARYISAAFGVALCVLSLAIGHLCFHPLAGIAASALVLCNALYRDSVTRAMTDSIFNFFLLATCLVGVFYLKDNSTNLRRQALVLTVGVLSGLAYSTKIHGAIIASLLFLLLVVYRACCRSEWLKHSLLDIAVYFLVLY